MLDMLVHLTGCVRNLTSLEIRIWDKSTGGTSRICTVVENFLKQVRCLESFASCDIDKSILDIVASLHGGSLRSLRFLKSELTVADTRHQQISYLSEEDSWGLSELLPCVERLGVNFNPEHPSVRGASSATCVFGMLINL